MEPAYHPRVVRVSGGKIANSPDGLLGKWEDKDMGTIRGGDGGTLCWSVGNMGGGGGSRRPP